MIRLAATKTGCCVASCLLYLRQKAAVEHTAGLQLAANKLCYDLAAFLTPHWLKFPLLSGRKWYRWRGRGEKSSKQSNCTKMGEHHGYYSARLPFFLLMGLHEQPISDWFLSLEKKSLSISGRPVSTVQDIQAQTAFTMPESRLSVWCVGAFPHASH